MKNPLAPLVQKSGLRVPSIYKAMAEMENEFDRWMQSSMPWSTDVGAFTPSCVLNETEKEYVLQFDLPGVKKEDVKIEMQNGRFTIHGERKDKKEEKEARCHYSETCYGSFMRSFTLPSEIDENKVDASYVDGVLTIKAPKVASTKTKEIKVH